MTEFGLLMERLPLLSLSGGQELPQRVTILRKEFILLLETLNALERKLMEEEARIRENLLSAKAEQTTRTVEPNGREAPG